VAARVVTTSGWTTCYWAGMAAGTEPTWRVAFVADFIRNVFGGGGSHSLLGGGDRRGDAAWLRNVGSSRHSVERARVVATRGLYGTRAPQAPRARAMAGPDHPPKPSRSTRWRGSAKISPGGPGDLENHWLDGITWSTGTATLSAPPNKVQRAENSMPAINALGQSYRAAGAQTPGRHCRGMDGPGKLPGT